MRFIYEFLHDCNDSYSIVQLSKLRLSMLFEMRLQQYNELRYTNDREPVDRNMRYDILIDKYINYN